MALVSAVDGQTLAMQDASTQSAWAGQEQKWIVAHNSDIGFFANPDTQFRRSDTGEIKSYTDLGRELAAAGYPGPWDAGSILDVYARTANTSLVPFVAQPAQPTAARPSSTAVLPSSSQPPATTQLAGPQPVATQLAGTQPLTIAGTTVTGNFGQWLNQRTHLLGVAVPNSLVLVGAGLGAYMLMGGGRRRRR
jgi:hypothetical protein